MNTPLVRTCSLMFALLLCVALPLTPQSSGTSYAIRDATIHTLAGEPIERGTILIRDGRIAGVGRKLRIPEGTEIIDAKGLDVYPGMIDAFSFLGLTEIRSVRATVDIEERGDFNPHLKAIIAVHPASEHIPVTRANGITHALVVPGTGSGVNLLRPSVSGAGSLMPGQASIVHLDGWTWEEMQIESGSAVVLVWPTIRVRARGAQGPPSPDSRSESYKKLKKAYDARIAELERWIESARHYAKTSKIASDAQEPDSRMEALLPVIEGRKPILVIANRDRAIRNAVAFAEKHKLKMILAGGFESWKVTDLLKEKDIPVILPPTQALPGHEDHPYDKPFAIASELHKAGIRFAFGTFSSANSRLLPYEAAGAVAFGLPREEALRAVTLYPAQILGIDDRFGTIEEGKVANLIITDGDPLEILTHIKYLFIQGRLTSTDNKHQRLYEKYSQRPR